MTGRRDTTNKLLTHLVEEKQTKRKGGLYHKTQVNLTYNSNRIEEFGSQRGYLLDTCLPSQDGYKE